MTPRQSKNVTLCQVGKIEKIPKGNLTENDLLERDGNGTATILYIILNGQLNLVPKEILTHRVLSQKDTLFRSGYYLASTLGSFGEIPKELINKDILCQSHNDTIDQPAKKIWAILIESKNIEPLLPFLDELIDEEHGHTRVPFLHLCAYHGVLNQIPKHYITKERVFATNQIEKRNLIHSAAIGGSLNEIPKEFLTKESMRITTAQGEAPIQIAAVHDNLHQVPKEFLTDEFLKTTFSKTSFNISAIQLAARNGSLKNFPEELLTEENFNTLELIDPFPSYTTPLFILCETYNNGAARGKERVLALEKVFKKLLSRLSPKTLENLKKDITEQNLQETRGLINNELLKRKIPTEFKKDMSIEI